MICRTKLLARLIMGLAVTLMALSAPVASAAGSPPASVIVTMTDSGFSPAAVTIPAGGSITWKNQGSATHTATTVGGAPSTFNTAGIGSGESATLVFTAPGNYYYTSGTDCLNNVSNPNFPCTLSYLITVGSPPAASTAPAAVAPPTLATGPAANAAVTISDTGFSPAVVNIGLNGTVTWTNRGVNVHTATSTSDTNTSLPPFDSGGLSQGQSTTVGFGTPGTYAYLSQPDCFSKSNAPGFSCAYYAVVVGTSAVAQPQGQAAPTATPVVVPGASATISIDDNNGFQPGQVSVKVGQTVSWLNLGNATHSVVINQNPTPDQMAPWWLPYQLPSIGGAFFDSGGLAPQQSFSYAFAAPGTYPYHSSTEQVYLTNYTNCSCTFITYRFFGTVVVTA